MLRGGVTCFNEMYFYPEAAARAALDSGMRAALGIIAFEFPTAYAADADDYIAKGLAARDALREEPLLSFCMAPHAPYTVSDRTFAKVVTIAEELDLPIHTHLHETQAEIEESLAKYKARPLERLRALGMLSPRLIAVHAVHVTGEEIAMLAHHGASVAHCPSSNLKLASGFAPVAAMIARGVNVGIGTDGAASNNPASTCSRKCAAPRSSQRRRGTTPRRCPRIRLSPRPRCTARARSAWTRRSARSRRASSPIFARSPSTSPSSRPATTRSRIWCTRRGGSRYRTCGSRGSPASATDASSDSRIAA